MAGIESLSQMLQSNAENRRLQKRDSRFRFNRRADKENNTAIANKKRESVVEKERWDALRRNAMRQVAQQYLIATLVLTTIVSTVLLLLK